MRQFHGGRRKTKRKVDYKRCQMIHQVPIAALLDFTSSAFETDVWGVGILPIELVFKSVTLGDIVAVPETDFFKRDLSYHAKRVAYLFLNGWFDPIEIDVGIPELGHMTFCPIQDGNHRFAAAVLRKDELISAEIFGSVDYAEELFGIKI